MPARRGFTVYHGGAAACAHGRLGVGKVLIVAVLAQRAVGRAGAGAADFTGRETAAVRLRTRLRRVVLIWIMASLEDHGVLRRSSTAQSSQMMMPATLLVNQ